MTFNLGTLVQSLIKKGVLLVIAILTQGTVGTWLTKFGITLDPGPMIVTLFSLYEGFRGWITHQPWTSKIPAWILALL